MGAGAPLAGSRSRTAAPWMRGHFLNSCPQLSPIPIAKQFLNKCPQLSPNSGSCISVKSYIGLITFIGQIPASVPNCPHFDFAYKYSRSCKIGVKSCNCPQGLARLNPPTSEALATVPNCPQSWGQLESFVKLFNMMDLTIGRPAKKRNCPHTIPGEGK